MRTNSRGGGATFVSCAVALFFAFGPPADAFRPPPLPLSTITVGPRRTYDNPSCTSRRPQTVSSRSARHPLQRLFGSKRSKNGASSQQPRNRDDPGDDSVSESDLGAIDWEALSAELVTEDEDDGVNDGDWLPDREKARQRKALARRIYAEQVVEMEQQAQQTKKAASKKQPNKDDTATSSKEGTSASSSPRPTAYTEEEEAVIAAMGGKTLQPQRRREAGFLGDSTLQEIATDYSVPISYIADVLAMWGVPVPIDVHDQLGNLVTGEQAFALLEAVNSLDVSQLHDRYSNTNILNLCEEWDIELREAFEMAMKEGWSLPFGVRTCLRVEQEEELLRVLGDNGRLDMSPYYDDDED